MDNKFNEKLAQLLSDYAQYKDYKDMTLLDFYKWLESIRRNG